ncbi:MULTISPECIES: hypothetical protein [Paraburkholderia]|uniref:hypothetical protein n=1 Tax=Paraburkholderia TaxID=1822464 RepID=UPI00224DBE7F|nr:MULTISPECIES: hypothetical protein [Paraburkholderia]MCX4163445.1 hypothetical protein [Paraburkholderia megapolitana]MDN7158940.1 hypothetical protein [Paraburkholderia sp. CHISQ3]MDQ6495987.1 hypothetical protein [Paraburkholderia megapolitana]
MNNKELQVEVTEMLSAGKKKQDVFAVLSGRGVKDRVVAYFIAAHLDPRRYAENKVHRGIIIAIICIQGLLGILAGISIAASDSPTLGLVVGAIVLLITGLFVWGFAKNKASVYNAFILLSIVAMPGQISSFVEDPVSTSLGMAIGVAVIVYVWYVRQRLFPDFAFLGVRKVNGQYVFSD